MRTGAPSRWPGHCRIYAVLKASRKPLSVAEIAGSVYLAEQSVSRILKDLRSMGLCHVKSRRRSTGWSLALWSYGYGIDAPPLEPIPQSTHRLAHYHRRKERIIEQFGIDIWKRINRSRTLGGAELLVVDGKRIYERGPK